MLPMYCDLQDKFMNNRDDLTGLDFKRMVYRDEASVECRIKRSLPRDWYLRTMLQP